MKNYIIWYWSIINIKNACLTSKVWDFLPINVNWFERWWNTLWAQWYVVLWVKKDINSDMNWILIEVLENIKDFDKREIMYNREKVEYQDIKAFKWDILPKWNYYIYLPKNNKLIPNKAPILQSYLDVVIKWCLDISEEFAYDFMKKTVNWRSILNDRENPKYVRSMDLKKYHHKLDEILKIKLSPKNFPKC